MGRTAPNADVVSGLIMTMSNSLTLNLATKEFESSGGLMIARLRYFEELETIHGITEMDVTGLSGAVLSNAQAVNMIIYHVSEFFRMSPAGTLYLAILLNGSVTADHVKTLQYFASGEIRQIGVLTDTIGTGGNLLQNFQVAANDLFAQHQPLSLIITYNGMTGTPDINGFVSQNYVNANRSNLSVLIGCDLAPELLSKIGTAKRFGCIGTCLGAISAASVHESIAWIAKFPLGLQMPGFITDTLLKDVPATTLELINDNRFIFVRTQPGVAGNYFNDSHTLDVITSDYANIENVRTMDKAIRGIRTNLLPELGGPVYVDPASGTLASQTVAYLETVAQKALNDMEKAGELSGCRAVIDPNQNVLATSEIEVVIKNVPVGVLRKISVKISYVTQLS